ncbi:MAG: cytochrome c nitrite reductase small subunit [Verrucomicrobiota bacterium]|nr:cytochrome c nitrite reductase small subunit [Verrucomicrobiota bacterium]
MAFNWSPTVKYKKLILPILCGVLIGLGGFTFQYAKGFSYFSNNPAACANCHIMQPQLDGWQKSTHHAVATCNDCHTPHDFIGKYMTKAENGYHHSKAFTLQNFHEPIMIREKNARIVNEACLHCHGELVSQITAHLQPRDQANSCTRCHAGVGHGTR